MTCAVQESNKPKNMNGQRSGFSSAKWLDFWAPGSWYLHVRSMFNILVTASFFESCGAWDRCHAVLDMFMPCSVKCFKRFTVNQ